MIKIGKVKINNSVSKNAFRMIYIFSILLTCLLLYISLKGFINVQVLNQSTLAEAIVTQNLFTPGKLADQQESYRVEFKYVVNSKEYIVQEDLGDKIIRYNVGEKIKIYYDNENIGKAQVYRVGYLVLVLAIVQLLGFTLCIITSEKRK